MSSKKSTTAIATEPKTAKVKTGPRKPIETAKEELFGEDETGEGEGEAAGVCYQIIKLFTKGYSRVDIVAAGYNRSTVYRQTNEYTKLRNAPATTYLGFELYEARIQRVMRTKKISREEAIQHITDKDTE